MTIKTIIWFTCGGIFGSLYANKYRGHHFLRRPHIHVITSLLGLAVGYQVHLIEENFEEDLREQKKLHPLAPYHPRETLLTYQAMVKRREEQEKIGDLDNESFDINEEEDDE